MMNETSDSLDKLEQDLDRAVKYTRLKLCASLSGKHNR